MATTRIPPDFVEFLRLLSAHSVRYLVVGGYAVGFHGYPRSTGALDVWIDSDAKNLPKLMQVLVAMGYAESDLTAHDLAKPNAVLRLGKLPVRIDIHTTLSGVDFNECYARAIEDEFEGAPWKVISGDDLKRNKRAAGRLRDLADLDYLP